MSNVTVLIIGAGAREHALSCAYERSSQVNKIIVAPGNDFISFQRNKLVFCDPQCSLKDAASLVQIAIKYKPEVVDVAQDDALAAGTVDLLQEQGFTVFGPSQAAARLEWDKQWSKEFMLRNFIPTPDFHSFDLENAAKEYLRSVYRQDPHKLMFIKATGLCRGKGALKAGSLREVFDRVRQILELGPAGETFLVEEGAQGQEFSSFAISDGKTYLQLGTAQDHKALYNHNYGPQTGGMGAFFPLQENRDHENRDHDIEEKILAPAIYGMNSEENPYLGILYAGGMISNGKVLCLEYNSRWGDPEAQVILPSIGNDYVELVQAAIEQKLHKVRLIKDDLYRVCVVGAAKSYPHSSLKGKLITGLEEAMKKATVYGAGIKRERGKFYTNGGRLFNVVGEGRSCAEAREKAYEAIKCIRVEGNNLHYRDDIGSVVG